MANEKPRTPRPARDELRSLRDEVRHLARRSAAEDLDDLRVALRAKASRSEAIERPVPFRPVQGTDGVFVRSLIGALVLLGLAWGMSHDWQVGRSSEVVQADPPSDESEPWPVLEPVAYTIERPVYETVFRDETYMVETPVKETVFKDETYSVQKPITKTVMVKKPYTVRRPIRETTYEDRVVTVHRPRTVRVTRIERLPVQRLEDSWVFNGWYWQNLPRYVTHYEDRSVTRLETRMVPKRIVRKTPVVRLRYVTERRFRDEPEERTEYVTVEATRQVPVERVRYERETRTRQTPERVVRYEREQRVRLVPVGQRTASDDAARPISQREPERDAPPR